VLWKSLDKSIIYSVAPPGASQHLSMLALDVKEFQNAKVRETLARHGHELRACVLGSGYLI